MVSLVAAHAQGGRCTSTDLGGKNACKGRCGDVFRREPFTFLTFIEGVSGVSALVKL